LSLSTANSKFFVKAPKISIDYAVMERTHKAAVLAADVGLSDVGQWSSVWRLSPQDAHGNSLRGRVVAIDSSNVLVRSDEHLAAVIGLDNVIVVSTGDAVLVADQSQSHKVKQLVERLKAEQHPEAIQHRLSPLRLLSERRSGCPIPGQAHRRQAWRPAVAAEALSSRRALDRCPRGAEVTLNGARPSCARERVDLWADRL
jgi:Mannose-6-phosphate isomerase